MKELREKIRIMILISFITGVIALFFPQWYNGILISLDEMIVLGPNVREIVLGFSMFSISILIISNKGLFKSLNKIKKQELYSLWAIWTFFGILITLIPTLHMLICYTFCINFFSYSILGLELVFSYISGITAIVSGLLSFYISKKK